MKQKSPTPRSASPAKKASTARAATPARSRSTAVTADRPPAPPSPQPSAGNLPPHAELASRILARRRLLPFVQRLNPRYQAGWVHEDICRRLERFSREVAEGKSPRLMILMPPRHGKQLAHDTPILTPSGWTTHGALQPGDYVFSPSGQPVEVVAVSQEAPQDCEIEFFDGSVLRCHERHEWTVYDRSRAAWRTVETRYLESQALTAGNRARFQLPATSALQTTAAELPIEPYFLGAWLGDGKSSAPVLCGAEADMDAMAAHIGHTVGARWVHGGTGVHYQNYKGLTKPLRELGVLGDKHIPQCYMLASEPQRRMLLAGLVDTDGSVELDTGRVRFRSGSERLASDVAQLARSLGYRASTDYTPADTRDRAIKGGPSWCVQWTPHDGLGGGRLPRKASHRLRDRRRVGVKAVRRVAPTMGRCIQVDAHDGLYLAGLHLTPTHNSELASRAFPAWHLGQYPDHEFIAASYNVSLAMSFSRKVKEVMADPAYTGVFQTRLHPDFQAAEEWAIAGHRGGYVAAGVGGGITGKGAHILTIDDPIKNAEEADSADLREKLWEWYTSTAYTRLAPGGGVLVIQTCWHDDDLAGKLQQVMLADPEADRFEIIRYPAIAETDEYLDDETDAIVAECPANGRLLRQKGAALHPARYDERRLAQIKRTLPPRWWSALYQQNPVPDEGVYFTKDMFRQATAPAVSKCYVSVAFDFAISEKQQNDYTVGTVTLLDESDVLHFVDRVRFKSADADFICKAIVALCKKWHNPSLQLGVEDGQIYRAISAPLKREFAKQRVYPSLHLLKPITDKQARARTLQGRMQQGLVSFASGAEWFDSMRTEMLRFPSGVHDDQVDSAAWNAILAADRAPPQPVKPASHRSWKDRLSGAADGTHMVA